MKLDTREILKGVSTQALSYRSRLGFQLEKKKKTYGASEETLMDMITNKVDWRT